MASTFDSAALVEAIDVTCGPCTCGLLFRRAGVRCVTCLRKDALLLDLLASTDMRGHATVETWMVMRLNREITRLGEPLK